MKYYLAYGSNLSVEQMAYRCPDAIPVGTAEIQDYRMLFKGSLTGSYLTIEPAKGRSVPVLVWTVTGKDEAKLDRYEGYPRFYRKENMRVKMRRFTDPENAEETEAFVYIMDESHRTGVPTDRYYRVCEEGYRRFGFDERILRKALAESTGGR